MENYSAIWIVFVIPLVGLLATFLSTFEMGVMSRVLLWSAVAVATVGVIPVLLFG